MYYGRKVGRVLYMGLLSFPPPFTASPARPAFYSSSVGFPWGVGGPSPFRFIHPLGKPFFLKTKGGRSSVSVSVDSGIKWLPRVITSKGRSLPPGMGLTAHPGNLKLSRSVVLIGREAAPSLSYYLPASLDFIRSRNYGPTL